MVRRTPRNKIPVDEAKAETKEANMEESGESSADDSSEEEMEAPELMVWIIKWIKLKCNVR